MFVDHRSPPGRVPPPPQFQTVALWNSRLEHRSIPIWSYAFVLSFVSVLVSEYGQLGNQHPDANPNFHASLSEGLFMADDLVAMIGLGIPAAAKSNLTDFVSQPGPPGASAVGAALNAMIAGPGPNFELQPTGMVPEMFRPMTNQFVQSTTVSNNPTRTLVNGASLPSLVTLASRSADGGRNVLVINQDPETDVTATVQSLGFRHASTADTSTLDGTTILSRNLPGDERVQITDSAADVGSGSFSYTFPAHSVTRIHLDGR